MISELKKMVTESNNFSDDEKELINFVIDRQDICEVCIVTYKDIENELGLKNKKFNKLIDKLNEYIFFNGNRDYNTYSGKYSENYGFKSLISHGGVRKKLVVNNVLLKKHLNLAKT